MNRIQRSILCFESFYFSFFIRNPKRDRCALQITHHNINDSINPEEISPNKISHTMRLLHFSVADD
ncbi:hypothetical protein DERP_001505 [Dermatophagoides pteronyssinus]|uniref:Uncharacterized protein n=1 Tax=Dermatophagoides pteronyssinus TaxID=6956 RepID=A0ABQ8JES1_DERPT|nr:hypothetical protein DERP_001505 [Dermatophagoides pteronyssinus]